MPGNPLHGLYLSCLTQAYSEVLALFAVVMCTYPFAKKPLTLHLARGEGRERYLGCNLMQRKVLASSYQHLMAEAPRVAPFRREGRRTVAYDKEAVYETIEAHSPGRRTRVVIPPQRNATLSQNSNTAMQERDRHIRAIERQRPT